jgi:RHS repeat-associated protein
MFLGATSIADFASESTKPCWSVACEVPIQRSRYNIIKASNVNKNIATGKVRYYHADGQGSIIGLTNESGQEVTQYAYDPFGNVTVAGESSDNPFQYTGRENDGTGLYYYRARYYSPELQRFISEDPFGLAGGINLVAYAGNSPLNYVDPLGLSARSVFLGTASLTVNTAALAAIEYPPVAGYLKIAGMTISGASIVNAIVEHYTGEMSDAMLYTTIVKEGSNIFLGLQWKNTFLI